MFPTDSNGSIRGFPDHGSIRRAMVGSEEWGSNIVVRDLCAQGGGSTGWGGGLITRHPSTHSPSGDFLGACGWIFGLMWADFFLGHLYFTCDL